MISFGSRNTQNTHRLMLSVRRYIFASQHHSKELHWHCGSNSQPAYQRYFMSVYSVCVIPNTILETDEFVCNIGQTQIRVFLPTLSANRRLLRLNRFYSTPTIFTTLKRSLSLGIASVEIFTVSLKK